MAKEILIIIRGNDLNEITAEPSDKVAIPPGGAIIPLELWKKLRAKFSTESDTESVKESNIVSYLGLTDNRKALERLK
jgi:hypothetical protein